MKKQMTNREAMDWYNSAIGMQQTPCQCHYCEVMRRAFRALAEKMQEESTRLLHECGCRR